MFKNYLKVAVRDIRRNLAYSITNIAGLAIGIACFLLLFLYVHNELTYDSHHPDVERIYRVSTAKLSGGEEVKIAGCSHLLGPALDRDYPDVEHVFVLGPHRASVCRRGTVALTEDNIHRTGSAIFDVLDAPFLLGTKDRCLDRPRTTVLTESVAGRYFVEENPIGQTLKIDTILYEVTGVVADPPANTHIKYRILCSENTQTMGEADFLSSWFSSNIPTYVKLAPNVDAEAFETRIAGVIHQYTDEETTEQLRLFLQPMQDIHLKSNLRWEVEAPGNPMQVYSLAVIGLLALAIAGFNYVNLATARAMRRSNEVGVRKVVGAGRGQVFRQFLGESVLLSSLSFVLALVLAEIALPRFSALSGTVFGSGALLTPVALGVGFVAALLVGLLGGSYPALVLSSMEPVRVLKGSSAGVSRRSLLRKVLVIGQFLICSVLIVGILTVDRQVDYMKNRPLGFETDQKLVLEIPGYMVDTSRSEAVKAEFMQHSDVLGATFSSSVPGRWNYQWRTYPSGQEAEKTLRMNWYAVDMDFVTQYDLELAVGRSFSREMPTDINGGLIINQAAVRAFGWQTDNDAIGQHLWNDRNDVLGVVKDFHLRGLQSTIEPFGMFLIDEDFRYLTLKVAATDIQETIAFVEETFRELFPEAVPNHFFLDSEFDRQYRSEEQLAGVVSGATMLSVLVACLGLFALAAYSAEQRTKEIGIRKVLGASVGGIVKMLTVESLILVGLAAGAGWPIAYWVAGTWLDRFAYRISIGWTEFFLSIGLSLLIGLFAVGAQALRAARTSPVDTLKYE